MTAPVALLANAELMWLYKWQTLPLDAMHFIFFYIYHPQRPSILLRVALSLAQADKTATAAHSAHLKLSPEHVLTSCLPLSLSLSLYLSICRKNKPSSMRTLWRSCGRSRTTLQWATMARATLLSSGFVFVIFSPLSTHTLTLLLLQKGQKTLSALKLFAAVDKFLNTPVR